MKKPLISAIAAISSKKRALGCENQLLWHLSEDLQRFKTLTLNHPIIMGRKTYDSIINYLGKPLPNRTSIVLTKGKVIETTGVLTVRSIEEAILTARELETQEIFIGGGSSIYELALPYTDRLYLTLVEDEPTADSFFPEYESMFNVADESKNYYQTKSGLRYSFVTLNNKNHRRVR